MNSSRKLSKYQKRLIEEDERYERYFKETIKSPQIKNEMRYNGNNGDLNVDCGRGSIQYYRQDPNGAVSVINVRLTESYSGRGVL